MLYFSPNLLEEAWRLFSQVKAIVCSTLYMHFEFSYCYLKYSSFVQYIHNKFCLENLFFLVYRICIKFCTGILNNKFKGARPCTHINQGSSSMHIHQSRELIHAHTSIKGAHQCIRNTSILSAAAEIQPRGLVFQLK